MNSFILRMILPVLLFGIGCGLFYRGVPKKGEFCNVLVRPPECLFVDFEKRKLIWEDKEYDLNLRTRMEYTFVYKGLPAELLVSTEHRLDLKVQGLITDKFFMRKKEKYTTYPKAHE